MRTHLVAVVMLACSKWMTSKALTGGVHGTETDPSGAVAANPKVTATNVDTGVATISTTDNGGIYNINILFLQIGSYKVRSKRSIPATIENVPMVSRTLMMFLPGRSAPTPTAL
jgi:hypothetical protein